MVTVRLAGHHSFLPHQRAVQESGEKGRGDEKLQQTIQLTMKRLETYLRVRDGGGRVGEREGRKDGGDGRE